MTADESAAMIALANRFSEAACARDIEGLRSVYTPDMVVWKNTDQNQRSVDEHLSTYATNTAALKGIRYSDIRVSPFEGGFVQQLVVVADLGDGRILSFPCCQVARVRDGRIARLEEYFDSAVFTSSGVRA